MGSKMTAGEASERLEAQLVGDAKFLIEGVAGPESATSNTACFVESESYLPLFKKSSALCWVTTPKIFESLEESAKKNKTFLLSEKPYLSFVKLVSHFHPTVKSSGKINSQSWIDPSAEIHESVQVDAFVVVGARTKVAAGAVLKAGVWIGDDVVIGEESILNAGVKIYHQCILGKRNTIHSGAVIGADGFGFIPDSSGLTKIPQVGKVVLHDDVEVGANSTIDRGTLEDTVIGRGTKIDNLVQIGHNCKIGKNVILCGFVGLAGNTTIGDNCLLAGQVGVAGHLTIGDNVQIAAQTGVSKDVASNQKVKGYPPQPLNEYLKLQVMIHKLPEIYKRLVAAEKKINESEKI